MTVEMVKWAVGSGWNPPSIKDKLYLDDDEDLEHLDDDTVELHDFDNAIDLLVILPIRDAIVEEHHDPR